MHKVNSAWCRIYNSIKHKRLSKLYKGLTRLATGHLQQNGMWYILLIPKLAAQGLVTVRKPSYSNYMGWFMYYQTYVHIQLNIGSVLTISRTHYDILPLGPFLSNFFYQNVFESMVCDVLMIFGELKYFNWTLSQIISFSSEGYLSNRSLLI